MKVYADNAATTCLDECAADAMKAIMDDVYGNPSQPYSFGRQAAKLLGNARETIAECIGADPENIFFTSGGTESDNWMIKCYRSDDQQRVITSSIEHHAILNPCKGRDMIKYIAVNEKGVIDLQELEDTLKSSVSSQDLVSVMYANNEIGTIEPIKEIAEMSHAHGAFFHTDAVQAIGHIPIDVKKVEIDALSASSHKFNGPRGIGFLYICDHSKLRPFIEGGTQESGLRAGTENVIGAVGMATALKNNCDNIEKNAIHLKNLESIMLKGLSDEGIDFIINGSDHRLPGLLSLSFKNCNGEMLLHRMDLMGICISTGSACDGKKEELSHVIKAIRVPQEYTQGTIRISLGKHNTEEDIYMMIKALSKIINSR